MISQGSLSGIPSGERGPLSCLLDHSWERPSFSAKSQPDWGEDSELPLSLECEAASETDH